MKMSIKKRLALGAAAVATVGAAATLVAGVTFGLFSATRQRPTQTAAFQAGTVTLGTADDPYVRQSSRWRPATNRAASRR